LDGNNCLKKNEGKKCNDSKERRQGKIEKRSKMLKQVILKCDVCPFSFAIASPTKPKTSNTSLFRKIIFIHFSGQKLFCGYQAKNMTIKKTLKNLNA